MVVVVVVVVDGQTKNQDVFFGLPLDYVSNCLCSRQSHV